MPAHAEPRSIAFHSDQGQTTRGQDVNLLKTIPIEMETNKARAIPGAIDGTPSEDESLEKQKKAMALVLDSANAVFSSFRVGANMSLFESRVRLYSAGSVGLTERGKLRYGVDGSQITSEKPVSLVKS